MKKKKERERRRRRRRDNELVNARGNVQRGQASRVRMLEIIMKDLYPHAKARESVHASLNVA